MPSYESMCLRKDLGHFTKLGELLLIHEPQSSCYMLTGLCSAVQFWLSNDKKMSRQLPGQLPSITPSVLVFIPKLLSI